MPIVAKSAVPYAVIAETHLHRIHDPASFPEVAGLLFGLPA
jgi:hypothetical protein